MPGAYQIKAHYYGSRQQTVAGACTVIAHVFLNYGRADEQKQVMTLRLDHPSDQVVVGEVAFAGSTAAPADWKARFGELRRGMTIDEVSRAVGQPARIEGADETVLVYEPAPGIVVHVRAAPRVIAVQQLMDGAILDLVQQDAVTAMPLAWNWAEVRRMGRRAIQYHGGEAISFDLEPVPSDAQATGDRPNWPFVIVGPRDEVLRDLRSARAGERIGDGFAGGSVEIRTTRPSTT